MRSIILAIGFLISAAGLARDSADGREVKSYKLTDAGFAKYLQATRNIRALPIGNCDLDSKSFSIDEATLKLDAAPGAKSAVESAGLTTREYVVMMWSVLHNSMAAHMDSQPGGQLPSGSLQSNIDVYKKHEADVFKLAEVPQNGGCG